VENSLFLPFIGCTETGRKIRGSAAILAIERLEGKMEKENTSQETGICLRCGRKLRSEKAKKDRMGEVCKRKWNQAHGHKKLFSLQRSSK
jgi:hypothetical protein